MILSYLLQTLRKTFFVDILLKKVLVRRARFLVKLETLISL